MPKVALLCAIFASPIAAKAELSPLSDEDLDGVVGQAILKTEFINNYYQRTDGSTLDFTRIMFGATINMNANIGHLELGNYARGGGTGCDGLGNECFGSPANPGQLNNWNCTTQNCDGFNADVIIKNLSYGRVIGDSTIETFKFEDPYIDFAFEGSGVNKKLVGVRLGFGHAEGIMGNEIEVLSGAIKPEVSILGIPAIIDLSGIRTQGYIPGFASLGAQLPVTDKAVVDSYSHYFSFQSRPIDYPGIFGRPAPVKTAQRGFWIDLYDGVNASLTDANHPDNYFPGHPLN